MVKTATLTLQKHGFACHPSIHFLGTPPATEELDWAIREVGRGDSTALRSFAQRRTLGSRLCAEENARLEAESGLGLDRFGYSLPSRNPATERPLEAATSSS
jgi:hypothetical protein